MPLQASTAGLLGRFAPSGFALCARILSRFAPLGFVLRTCILGRFAPSGFCASHSHSQSLCSLGLRALHSHPQSLCSLEIFKKKKSVSQSTQNALKRVKMQKIFFYSFWPITRFARSAKFTKIFEKNKCVSIDSKCSETHRNAKKNFYPFDRLRASRVAQSPSGVAQWNFNTINRT